MHYIFNQGRGNTSHNNNTYITNVSYKCQWFILKYIALGKILGKSCKLGQSVKYPLMTPQKIIKNEDTFTTTRQKPLTSIKVKKIIMFPRFTYLWIVPMNIHQLSNSSVPSQVNYSTFIMVLFYVGSFFPVSSFAQMILSTYESWR